MTKQTAGKKCVHFWKIYGEIENILPNCPILDCHLMCVHCGKIIQGTIKVELSE